MRKLIQLIALSAIVATASLPVFAQGATPTPSPAAAAGGQQDDGAAKAALYQKVLDNYKTNQPVAYEAAKEFLQKYPDHDPKAIEYLKNYVAKYEKATVQLQFPKLIADKKYNEAFALGKKILASDPENLSVTMNLGYAGYLAAYSKNTAFNADAINYAKRAIEMIESGKTTDSWAPFTNKDEALAYLNYALGFLNLETNKSDAITHLVKSAQNEAVKKEPFTYHYLAYAYETGPYKTESAAVERFTGQPETPESKAALDSLNQTVDRVVDAYARAIAYATDAKYQADKARWMTRLTELYKFRHNNSDAGLNEMIANVRNSPIPPPATAAPATPTATTPTTTPATTGTDGGTPTTTTPTPPTGTTTPATPANTTQPGNTGQTTPTTTTPSTTTPKPSSTPSPATAPTQPAKPKP
ncbi:MAG: hypothetical protein WCF57_23740 [Pyrinomonadaceae bacterium]